ncbi:MAG: hypothetical protein ABSA76_01295 [Bacteroidales bacterium]
MKTLFKVSCTGGNYTQTTNSDIYVIAETVQEASDKALAKMKELGYDKVDDYVSALEVIADEKEISKKLLII